MDKQKLKTWLEATKLNPNRNLLYYLMFSHVGRAIIMAYSCVYCKNLIIKIISRKFLRAYYHIEIGCKEFGNYLSLPHPRNIIIAAESVGDHVQINQNVTIGGNMKKIVTRHWGIQKLPIIGNNCVIYTNAVVGGPVTIGDNVIIGSNCTCTHDVEENLLLYNKCEFSRRKIIVNSGTYDYTK